MYGLSNLAFSAATIFHRLSGPRLRHIFDRPKHLALAAIDTPKTDPAGALFSHTTCQYRAHMHFSYARSQHPVLAMSYLAQFWL